LAIYVISVGKSILDFLRDPCSKVDEEVDERFERAAKEVLSLAEKPVSDEVSETLENWLKDKNKVSLELAKLIERLAPAHWPASVSAELDTFDKATRLRARLTTGNTAVLITSDTAQGLVSALWNALVLTGGDAKRVNYLPELPGSLQGMRGTAVIARVPQLDARNADDFRAAMGYLGELGRKLLRDVHQECENIRFYLSGGFKATIPYLIGLAEGMRSCAPGEVTACVLHEATEATIELPLRRLFPGTVREELKPFRAGNVSNSEPGGLLEGYAYEKTSDGRWELTAFGAGLRALYKGNEVI